MGYFRLHIFRLTRNHIHVRKNLDTNTSDVDRFTTSYLPTAFNSNLLMNEYTKLKYKNNYTSSLPYNLLKLLPFSHLWALEETYIFIHVTKTSLHQYGILFVTVFLWKGAGINNKQVVTQVMLLWSSVTMSESKKVMEHSRTKYDDIADDQYTIYDLLQPSHI